MSKEKTNNNSKTVQETQRRRIMKQEKVVIYTRVSSQEQAKKGYSLEAQQENLRKYAKANNLKIVKEFSDIASGSDKNRNGYQKMLKFLESSENCNTILVTKLDRLSRDVEAYQELKNKYSIIVATDGICAQDATPFEEFIKGMMANYYNELQSQIMKDAWKRRKEREAQQKEVELRGGKK